MQNVNKEICPGMVPSVGEPPGGDWTWRWVSERGLRVATGNQTLSRYALLKSQKFDEIEDLILADGSLLLVLRRGAAISESLCAALLVPLAAEPWLTGAQHQIGVEYGGTAGPDLSVLAGRAGMDVLTYINAHAAVEYTVAFLGFQPGFPYLTGLPRVLQAPRLASPRLRVEAGSVAIGGAYCGIYPMTGPGGWQIIGRTASVLFDARRDAPALLMPGDRVRFVPL